MSSFRVNLHTDITASPVYAAEVLQYSRKSHQTSFETRSSPRACTWLCLAAYGHSCVSRSVMPINIMQQRHLLPVTLISAHASELPPSPCGSQVNTADHLHLRSGNSSETRLDKGTRQRRLERGRGPLGAVYKRVFHAAGCNTLTWGRSHLPHGQDMTSWAIMGEK